jgi:hypothetical protein
MKKIFEPSGVEEIFFQYLKRMARPVGFEK